MQPTYDIHQSYDANYAAGPRFDLPLPEPRIGKPTAKFLGHRVTTPFGVPAGPLLNSDWIRLYARLGFDLLVYKTVRSAAQPCHPLPNCLYLDLDRPLTEADQGGAVAALADQATIPPHLSITNSFGMPSRPPAEWQADLAQAIDAVGEGQVVVASVVGSAATGDLVADFGRVVAMAAEVHPHAIEINLSCPNVAAGEGVLFHDPEQAGRVAWRAWSEAGSIPLVIKIGYLADPARLEAVMAACGPFIQGVAAINTIPMAVHDRTGHPALGPGRPTSGVCGEAIRDLALKQVRRLVAVRTRLGMEWSILGVGGITTPADIDTFLAAGADGAMAATGAMWNPLLAQQWWALHHEGIGEKGRKDRGEGEKG